MTHAMLADLPLQHALRAQPLAAIGAEYRNVHAAGSVWHAVQPHAGIAKASYNDLRGTWLENNVWRAPISA